jgi:tRNA-2-methylthio-N6-dimethylallyladenosine synthase
MSNKTKTYKNFAPKVFIRTFGCQMNLRDSELICGMLLKKGYTLTEEESEADIILFNTCSVRKHAEDRVWGKVGTLAKLKRIKPDSIIGIIGCMAENFKEEIFQRLPHVDLVCGPNRLSRIPDLINQIRNKRCQVLTIGTEDTKEKIYDVNFRGDSRQAWVSISEGCSNFCSYCIVPYVRGKERCRDYREILSEIEELVTQGLKDIILLGQNVNSYFGGIGFIELLKEVVKIESINSMSFITSHPKDIREELFYLMRDSDKIKKELHLPVQSGSNRILSLMNRGYAREHYLGLARLFRELIPTGSLTTDIMVGFPTETEEDFRDTFSLMQEIQFEKAYIFKYSPRPNTKASQLNDNVPKEIKEKRHKILLDFQKKLSLEKRCVKS